jgi:hypothetical protein
MLVYQRVHPYDVKLLSSPFTGITLKPVNHCDFEKTGTSEIRAMAMDNGVSFGQC